MNMEVVDRIKERVNELLKKYNGFKSNIDEVKDWNSFNEIVRNVGILTDFMVDIVMAVELSVYELADEIVDISSAEKRLAAAQFLDSLVNLPWYLEIIDGPAFEIMISIVVEMLNKYMGHDWNLNFMHESLRSGTSFIHIYKRERGIV